MGTLHERNPSLWVATTAPTTYGYDRPSSDRPTCNAWSGRAPLSPSTARPAGTPSTKLNNRTHRRLLMVDGQIGFAGGVGIAEVWTGDAEDPERWRETHARIEAPPVRDVLVGFAETWAEATTVLLGAAHLPELSPCPTGSVSR